MNQSDFSRICDVMATRVVKGRVSHEETFHDERMLSMDRVVVPEKPKDHESIQVELVKATGTITATWGENRVVMKRNKDGSGYHSFLYFSIREDAACNEHATLDAMIEHACAAKWN
jgi:hypothetical protein